MNVAEIKFYLELVWVFNANVHLTQLDSFGSFLLMLLLRINKTKVFQIWQRASGVHIEIKVLANSGITNCQILERLRAYLISKEYPASLDVFKERHSTIATCLKHTILRQCEI